MLRFKIVLLTLTITCGQWIIFAQDADAGLLRDWFRRWRRPAQVPVYPTTGYVASSANYAGLQPGQCMKTCQQTCSRVVVNYVPCTSYRTTYERVPVTTYRPQTSSDPCTGCTVTCMRPCTTYTYRTRRVPYTTYRPVYRTQTYRVPVTTITNDCNTCSTAAPVYGATASTCDTCSTAAPLYGQTVYGTQGQTVPNGTITTQDGYGTQPVIPGATVTPLPTPADTTPGINPQDSNRSVIDGVNGSSTRYQPQPTNWALTSTKKVTPERSARIHTVGANVNRDWSDIPVVDVADRSPVTRKWAYSPIKQAAYVSLDDQENRKIKIHHGSFSPVRQDLASKSRKRDENTSSEVNSGWKTVQW